VPLLLFSGSSESNAHTFMGDQECFIEIYSTRHHGNGARGNGCPQEAHLPLLSCAGPAAAAGRGRHRCGKRSIALCGAACRLSCGRLGGLVLAIVPKCCVFAVSVAAAVTTTVLKKFIQ
jgi:hypothetical protein